MRAAIIMARPGRFRCTRRQWAPALGVCIFAAAATSIYAAETPTAAPLSLDIPQLHSDVKFALLAPARKEPTQAEQQAGLHEQAERVAEGLQRAALVLYPQQMEKLVKFDVYIGDAGDPGTISSASGRIALNTGFADLKPSDGWLAFVIAREMGHILAGHHDRNSLVSMIASALLNVLIPGSALLKQALSFAGSQIAGLTGRPDQVREADEIALKLMEAAGYSSTSLAVYVAFGPANEQLGTSMWASSFADSADQIITKTGLARTAAAKLIRVPAASTTDFVSAPANTTEMTNTAELASAPASVIEIVAPAATTSEVDSPATVPAELHSAPTSTAELEAPAATVTELVAAPEIAVALQR
jgi:hypothetical protein